MRKFVTLAACLVLAACGGQADDGANDTGTSQDAVESTEPKMMPVEPDGGIGDSPNGGPLSGDNGTGVNGPRPMLQNMTYNDFANVLESGLSCSFQTGPEGGALLVATAPGDWPATGDAAVKINDTVVVMKYNEKGGFDALMKGGTFTSEALSVTVKRSEGEGKKVGVETMTWPATMTIAQDEGGTNSYDGTYACGA